MTSQGHLSRLEIPYGLCFLSLFSINLINSLKNWHVKCFEYMYFFCSFLLLSDLMWMLCLVVCFIFLLVTTLSVWKCDFVFVKSALGKHWKCVEVWGWYGECLSDKFPLKVWVWSGYECIFYVLWIKGKSKIKLNLTRYNTILTVAYFWRNINWTANTLIHMYRDLGHGQPRFSSESGLESVMEKLKTLLGHRHKPTMELLHDCLNPEKDLLHLTSKKTLDHHITKFRADHPQLGWVICLYLQGSP